MNAEIGSVAFSSTGNKTISLNGSFTPVLVEFEIGPRNGTNETDIRWSRGCADGTNQYAQSIFNATNDGTRESTSKCIMHYIDSGGATLKVQGSWVSFGLGTITINMDTVDVNYSIRFKAFG